MRYEWHLNIYDHGLGLSANLTAYAVREYPMPITVGMKLVVPYTCRCSTIRDDPTIIALEYRINCARCLGQLQIELRNDKRFFMAVVRSYIRSRDFAWFPNGVNEYVAERLEATGDWLYAVARFDPEVQKEVF